MPYPATLPSLSFVLRFLEVKFASVPLLPIDSSDGVRYNKRVVGGCVVCSPRCYTRLQEDYRNSPHLAAKYSMKRLHLIWSEGWLSSVGAPLQLVGLNNLLLMKHLHVLILLFVFVQKLNKEGLADLFLTAHLCEQRIVCVCTTEENSLGQTMPYRLHMIV